MFCFTDMAWLMRVPFFERVVCEKMDPDIDIYYGDAPRYVIMRTKMAYLIQTDTWCPDCMNVNKRCVFHEEKVPKRKYERLREHVRYDR